MRKNILVSIVLLLLILAIVGVRSSGVPLTKEGIQTFVQGYGASAPLVYIIVYVVGICLLLPATILSAAGAVTFGVVKAFLFTIVAATLGSVGAFLIARYVGGEAIRKLTSKWLAQYDEGLEKNTFTVVFYLRLLYMPFSVMSFACGLTKMSLSRYTLATFLGILPGTFIFSFFIDELTNVRSFSDALQPSILFAVGLFLLSLALPLIIKKVWKPAAL